MSKPFDATSKDLLEAGPADWLAFLHRPPADRVEVIDSDLSTVSTAADKVLRVHDPDPGLLHLEFQAARDVRLPSRTLRYNVLLDYRHDLPVQSVVVLLCPEADGPELTGVLQRRHRNGDIYLEFRYQVVRVWQQPVNALLAGGLATLPLAPLSDLAEEALPAVLQRIEKRLRREASPAQADLLRAATFVLAGLRYPPEILIPLFQGMRAMRESSTYQYILAEGKAEGIAEGKAEGIAEGKAKGKTEGVRQVLLVLGRKRFGPPDASIRKALKAITDLTRLTQLSERLLDVGSWQELLDLPGSEHSTGRRSKRPKGKA
jgi:predicted transposase YdaD